MGQPFRGCLDFNHAMAQEINSTECACRVELKDMQ
jgi:hypothetical protein